MTTGMTTLWRVAPPKWYPKTNRWLARGHVGGGPKHFPERNATKSSPNTQQHGTYSSQHLSRNQENPPQEPYPRHLRRPPRLGARQCTETLLTVRWSTRVEIRRINGTQKIMPRVAGLDGWSTALVDRPSLPFQRGTEVPLPLVFVPVGTPGGHPSN